MGMRTKSLTFERVGAAPLLFVCDHFIEVREAAVVLRHIERLEIEGHPCTRTERTSAGSAYEAPCDSHPLLKDMRKRIEEAVGLDNPLGAAFRFRRYLPGESHPPHVDDYEVGGLRLIATAMLYLTTAESGGETLFPNARPAPVAVRARAQRLAVWINLDSAGAADETSLHEAAAVVAGVKATLGYFFYGDPKSLKRSRLVVKSGARLRRSRPK